MYETLIFRWSNGHDFAVVSEIFEGASFVAELLRVLDLFQLARPHDRAELGLFIPTGRVHGHFVNPNGSHSERPPYVLPGRRDAAVATLARDGAELERRCRRCIHVWGMWRDADEAAIREFAYRDSLTILRDDLRTNLVLRSDDDLIVGQHPSDEELLAAALEIGATDLIADANRICRTCRQPNVG